MVGVPEEQDQYTALSSLTVDKKDGSQYTSLIKTPRQTTPVDLRIIHSPELDCAYTLYKDEEVGVPEEEDKYTALSSLTADKKDGSQYTSLIRTLTQTVPGSNEQPSDAPFHQTQPSVQESGQK